MMESKKKVFSLYDIVMIGLMAAVVFVVTMFLSIRIPTPTGTTMIKLANAFVCCAACCSDRFAAVLQPVSAR